MKWIKGGLYLGKILVAEVRNKSVHLCLPDAKYLCTEVFQDEELDKKACEKSVKLWLKKAGLKEIKPCKD